MEPDTFVLVGETLTLTMDAEDVLSGVKQVRAAIDVERAHQFTEAVKAVNATQQTDGRWMLSLPTAQVPFGNYDVLLQATDAVGNTSSLQKVELTVLSKEQAAEHDASMVVDVTGAVSYGEQGQPGIDVALTKPSPKPQPKSAAEDEEPEGEVVAKTQTDEQGDFQIRRVAPGEYQLTAEGIVRNKIRKATAKLVIKPGTPPQPVELKLPP
jgi:hypothetical protein